MHILYISCVLLTSCVITQAMDSQQLTRVTPAQAIKKYCKERTAYLQSKAMLKKQLGIEASKPKLIPNKPEDQFNQESYPSSPNKLKKYEAELFLMTLKPQQLSVK